MTYRPCLTERLHQLPKPEAIVPYVDALLARHNQLAYTKGDIQVPHLDRIPNTETSHALHAPVLLAGALVVANSVERAVAIDTILTRHEEELGVASFRTVINYRRFGQLDRVVEDSLDLAAEGLVHQISKLEVDAMQRLHDGLVGRDLSAQHVSAVGLAAVQWCFSVQSRPNTA